ncbi:RNA polymerase sigma factor [Micromonospora sp. NPDC049559]|uniref:RNA polymerase sigma factor n=1 Tax=Micromonospora sp. NPDC049559 TaxID=3155923 RepID=UPI00344AA46C
MLTAQTQAQELKDFPDYYREDFARLIRFLITQGASLAEAEDVAQETMKAALLVWPTIDHPQAWTRLVARRTLWRGRRQSLRERELMLRHGRLDEVTEAIFDTEVCHVLQLLNRLPVEQRDVMAWTIDGYTPNEIASRTGQKPATVRSHLRYARRQLIRRLGQSSPTARKEASDGP